MPCLASGVVSDRWQPCSGMMRFKLGLMTWPSTTASRRKRLLAGLMGQLTRSGLIRSRSESLTRQQLRKADVTCLPAHDPTKQPGKNPTLNAPGRQALWRQWHANDAHHPPITTDNSGPSAAVRNSPLALWLCPSPAAENCELAGNDWGRSTTPAIPVNGASFWVARSQQ